MKTLARFGYIDSLRGIAILMVLIAHVAMYSNHLPARLVTLFSVDVGPRGVQLFYIVSAFTLCLSFARRKDNEQHPLRNFYIRRFFRIAPVFYIAIIYYLWQSYIMSHTTYSFWNIITTLTFTNGFFPYWINNIVFGGWSIAIEMTFYAIFPLLFYLFKTIKTSMIWTIIVMLLMQIVRLYLLTLPIVQHDTTWQTFTFQFFPSQLPVFLIGMTTFMLMNKSLENKEKTWLKLSVLFVIISVVVDYLFQFKLIAGHYIYVIVFALFLYLLSKFPIQIIVNKFMRYIGKISFSMYLWHIAILDWLLYLRLSNNFIVLFVLVFCITLLISSLSYYFIEVTGQKIGKKIIDKYEKKTTATVSTSTW